MELQVGVKVLLKNPEGKYLLLRRSAKKYPEVGSTWDIVGGRINPGTELMENLKREIWEETRLTLEDQPRLVAAQDILRPDKHVVRLTYASTISGEPQLDEDHDEYRWYTMDEIKKLDNLDVFFKYLLEQGLFHE